MIKPKESPLRKKDSWGPYDTQNLVIGAVTVALVGSIVFGFMKFVL